MVPTKQKIKSPHKKKNYSEELNKPDTQQAKYLKLSPNIRYWFDSILRKLLNLIVSFNINALAI